MKPAGYPLPWCDALDVAYWRINMSLCANPRWRQWQKGREMAEIIPRIDRGLRLWRRPPQKVQSPD